jgi:hypothetical protein
MFTELLSNLKLKLTLSYYYFDLSNQVAPAASNTALVRRPVKDDNNTSVAMATGLFRKEPS